MSETINNILVRFGKERSNLLPILQGIEKAENGISPEAIKEVSRYLDLSENYTYSVVTFYPHLHLKEAASQS